jgi:dTMP kinase
MKQGFLVAVDGVDGSGKSTICNILHDHLYERRKGLVMQMQLPGGTPLGQEIRKLVKSVKKEYQIDEISERLLFCADNVNTLATLVIPSLAKGMIIVSDRWSMITDHAYGVAGGLDPSVIQQIQSIAPSVKPDLYIILRCSFETARERMALRMNSTLGSVQQPCRIEQKGEPFLRAVCEQYANNNSVTMNRAYMMAKKVVVLDANEGLDGARAAAIEAVDRAFMDYEQGG